jgi:hypothetical protein
LGKSNVERRLKNAEYALDQLAQRLRQHSDRAVVQLSQDATNAAYEVRKARKELEAIEEAE